MSDYIKRDDVLDYLRGLLALGDAVFIDPAKEIEIVESIPAADVEPVRRGHWKLDEEEFEWGCGVCGEHICVKWYGEGRDRTYRMPFCPRCGAKMEGAEID